MGSQQAQTAQADASREFHQALDRGGFDMIGVSSPEIRFGCRYLSDKGPASPALTHQHVDE